ncbi:hypothetical protein BGL52_04910 [Lacticaseibacillus casei]|uniref:Uncharacterized protein n=3 Tax=Lacticaseibacillus TaxID=2759736 RepID=A0AAN1C7F0_LACCA|nr:hypothetical protein BGL52_04910 [Lacticaseibacillus casei]
MSECLQRILIPVNKNLLFHLAKSDGLPLVRIFRFQKTKLNLLKSLSNNTSTGGMTLNSVCYHEHHLWLSKSVNELQIGEWGRVMLTMFLLTVTPDTVSYSFYPEDDRKKGGIVEMNRNSGDIIFISKPEMDSVILSSYLEHARSSLSELFGKKNFLKSGGGLGLISTRWFCADVCCAI